MKLLPLIAAIALTTAAMASHAGIVPLNLLDNGDFETVNGDKYKNDNGKKNGDKDTVAAWSFVGLTGVKDIGDRQGNAAFLESRSTAATPKLTQSFMAKESSAVAISFTLAKRAGYGDEGVRVLLDGIDLTPQLLMAGSTDWTRYTLNANLKSNGKHELSFEGVNRGNSPGSVLIDNVNVISAPATPAELPEPGVLALVAAGLVAAAVVRRKR